MKFLNSCLLLFLLSLAIVAQQTVTVTGQVITYLGGRSGVNSSAVTLTAINDPGVVFKVTADSEGRFRIDNVPPGDYRISANSGILAYSMSGEKRIKVSSGQNEAIELVVGTDGPRESVTIAADAAQTTEQVSKSVNVIDGQEMRDRADFTLIDTVRTLPGFRVQQLGGFGRTASIKSRGLRNQDTAVLIDGIRFRDPGSITGDATPFLSDFTLTSVSKIEVLRGSGSSLYGTNAVGGTIDFQTPEAKPGVHGQIGGAFGGLGLGRFRGNLSYGTDDNKFGIGAGGSRTAYTKGIDGEDNAGNTNFQTRVDYKPFSTTDISARFFVSEADVRLNVSPDTFGTLPPVGTIINAREGINFISDESDPDSIQDSRFFSGQFAANHAVNSRLVIGGYYQGLVTERNNKDGLLGPPFQSEFTSGFGGTIHTANVHATWTPNASNTFTGGYEFELERFRNEGSTPSASEGSVGGVDEFWTRANQRSNTLYAQHRVSLLDGDLQFAGGARAQWFSLGTPEFSAPDSPYADATLSDPPAAHTFDGSASYFISSTGTKFRTHVGNGYRVPSLYERFGSFFFFGSFFAQGNPELKPERSLGIDAGVEQYFANQKVRLSATYFYTKVKDEITYLPTDDFGAPVYYNFDRHYSRGIETSVEIKPTKSTDVFASYTFTNSDIRNFRRPSIASLASVDRAAFGIPGHQFTLVATQRFERFWVTFDFLATSSYLAPVFSSSTFRQYTYRFEGNRRGDLTAGYTFPLRGARMTLRVYGTIENMFDNEYFENGFRTPGMNGRVGVSFGF
jgi:iron complex outermembrane receptor protein